MRIIINGKEEFMEKEELTISELLKLKNVKMPEMVSVELNGEFLERKEYETTIVKENDKIEFLYFMGGGI